MSEVTALAERRTNGITDLAAVTSAQEMAARLADMKQRINVVQAFFKDVMKEGEDYGIIPGTDKPTLLKPGAEKLCEFYGYSIHVSTEREEKDRSTGWYDCAIKVTLISRRTGEVIAEGVGEANTYEARYRYRWVWESQLPPGIDKNSLPKRQTRSGAQYRIDNDDLFTLWNTVKKMAKKRALIDAVLSATRSSGIFTQDLEDLREWAAAGQVIDADYEAVAEPTNHRRESRAQPAAQRTPQPNHRPAGTKANRMNELLARAKALKGGQRQALAWFTEVTGKRSPSEATDADWDAFERMILAEEAEAGPTDDVPDLPDDPWQHAQQGDQLHQSSLLEDQP